VQLEQLHQFFTPLIGREMPAMDIRADDKADDLFFRAFEFLISRRYSHLYARERAVAAINDPALVRDDRVAQSAALDVADEFVECLTFQQVELDARGMERQQLGGDTPGDSRFRF
jgi:hypothetical protein